MSKRENWIWMPHPGHFICGFDCRFRLNTYVGGYIVSTVGELFPDAPVREIIAKSRGIELKGIGGERKYDFMKRVGWDDIGCDCKYETMVFKAQKNTRKDSLCCPWEQVSGTDLDMDGYNDPVAAYEGHLKLCEKWSKKRK